LVILFAFIVPSHFDFLKAVGDERFIDGQMLVSLLIFSIFSKRNRRIEEIETEFNKIFWKVFFLEDSLYDKFLCLFLLSFEITL